MTEAWETFSVQSQDYAKARPKHPKELYSWILDQTSLRNLAWDCACGNGQAAVDIAPHFMRVLASDISQKQLDNAVKVENVEYVVCSSETSPFPDKQFDLVVVAQALHWFDFDHFWPEIERVSKVGSFFCAWGYSSFSCSSEVQINILNPINEVIAPFWSEKNELLWNGYRPEDIKFPSKAIRPEQILLEQDWKISALIDYIQTWSAYKIAAQHPDRQTALNNIVSSALNKFSGNSLVNVKMPMTVIDGHLG